MKEKQDSTNESKLCVVCSRFYGSAEKNSMCSKCYAEHIKRQLGEKPPMEAKLLPPPPIEEAKKPAVPASSPKKEVSPRHDRRRRR